VPSELLDLRSSGTRSIRPLPDDAVRCELCGGHYVVMASHLTTKHGINAKEYKRRFPGARTAVAGFAAEKREQAFEIWPGRHPRNSRPAPSSWVEAYQAGEGALTIARRRHVSEVVVRARLRAAGVELRRPGRPRTRPPRPPRPPRELLGDAAVTCAWMPLDMIAALDVMARERETTRSALIRDLLSAALAKGAEARGAL
jgi:hypothetical protein